MAKFTVICVRTKREILGEDLKPRIFTNGETAQDFATQMTKISGEKYQPRRLKENIAWRDREAKRFYDGTYYPVPWDTEWWWHDSAYEKEHFAHVSIENDAKVAFTPDEESGEIDRQVRMSPGRYLERYFRDVLTRNDIRHYATEFSVTYDNLKYEVAHSADDIREVYLNGPSSCMAHPTNDYPTEGIHPVEAYAGPDLAVAYLRSQDGNDDYSDEGSGGDRFSARSVIWPEKKIYTRIYGDAGRLRPLLEKDGFKSGDLAGARLSRIPIEPDADMFEDDDYEAQPSFVCPYLDTVGKVKDDGKYLIIDRHGFIPAQSTAGVIYDSRHKCDDCGQRTENPRWQQGPDGVHDRNRGYCPTCQPRHPVLTDINYGGYISRDDAIVIDDSGYGVHRRNNPEDVIVIDSINGGPMWRRDAVMLKDGRWVSHEWFNHSGTYCQYCSEPVPRRDRTPCGANLCPALPADVLAANREAQRLADEQRRRAQMEASRIAREQQIERYLARGYDVHVMNPQTAEFYLGHAHAPARGTRYDANGAPQQEPIVRLGV